MPAPSTAFADPDPDLPLDARPAIGADLERFRIRFGLSKRQVELALGYSTPAAYAQAQGLSILPPDVDLLLRLYRRHPGFPPWTPVLPIDAFRAMYQPLLEAFEPPHQATVRRMLYNRFAKLLGRSVFRAYDWIERGGRPSAVTAAILGKVMDRPRADGAPGQDADGPGALLEQLGREVWRLRQADLDRAFPLPDPMHPPRPRPRGRVAGSRLVGGLLVPPQDTGAAERLEALAAMDVAERTWRAAQRPGHADAVAP